jgi:hypothetical protein
MSTVGGSFDETILLNQRVRAMEIFFDDRIKQQFTPQYNIINALKAAQTAQVLTPLAKRKDVDVEVIWENFCDITADTCETDCTLGGDKSSTNHEHYALSFCKEVHFSMDENDFIDNEFDINIAKALLKADKELTEAYAAYCVSQLEAFKGCNKLTTGKGDVVATDTFISAAYWTPALVAYFNRVSIMNRFTNPIFLSGSNLYEQYFVAQANNANADGKGDSNLWSGLQPYFDLFNIDTVNTPDLVSYLISMGSVALANKWYNPAVPERGFDMFRYTMPSQFTGFTYDVFYNNACEGTNKLWAHNYNIRLKADLFNNPEGCENCNTGVLAFRCGESGA